VPRIEHPRRSIDADRFARVQAFVEEPRQGRMSVIKSKNGCSRSR
jgi:hypothetical protein